MKSTGFVARYGGEEFMILSLEGLEDRLERYTDGHIKKGQVYISDIVRQSKK